MKYFTITLESKKSLRLLDYTVPASTIEEAIRLTRDEYPENEYTFIMIEHTETR